MISTKFESLNSKQILNSNDSNSKPSSISILDIKVCKPEVW